MRLNLRRWYYLSGSKRNPYMILTTKIACNKYMITIESITFLFLTCLMLTPAWVLPVYHKVGKR